MTKLLGSSAPRLLGSSAPRLLGSSAPRLLLAAALLAAPPARATTWLVTADEPETSSYCTNGIGGPDELPLAIDHALPGDVIVLCAGVHHLDRPEELRIQGRGTGDAGLSHGVMITGEAGTQVTSAVDVTWEACVPGGSPERVTPTGTTCRRSVEYGDELFAFWEDFEAEFRDGGVDHVNAVLPDDGGDVGTFFPVYGSFEDGQDLDGDGSADEVRRIALVPYRDWASFASTREISIGSSWVDDDGDDETPKVWFADREVYYGPGLFFDMKACQIFRDGPGGSADDCRIYLRADQTALAADVHGLDHDDGSDVHAIDIDTVRVFPPHSWQFLDVKDLVLSDLTVEDVAALRFSGADGLTLGDLDLHLQAGVRLSASSHASLVDVGVDNRTPRTFYFGDWKGDATGHAWDGSNCDGAAQLLCVGGISFVNGGSDHELEHSVVKDTWVGITVGDGVDDVRIHHDRVEWAHDDAIRLTSQSSRVEVSHDEVVNSYLGIILIPGTYTSTVSSHFLHHNVVDLPRDLGAAMSGTPSGSTSWMGAGRRFEDPITFDVTEAVYQTNIALGYQHADCGNACGWPAVIYNNTLISDAWEDRLPTVIFPVRIADPLVESWEAPATWFVKNVVVQENGSNPLVSDLAWWPRDGMEPAAVSDGNAWLQYAPSPGKDARAKFFDVAVVLDGALGGDGGPASECAEAVFASTVYDFYLGQDLPPLSGEPDRCWGLGVASNRYADLDRFRRDHHCDPNWGVCGDGGGVADERIAYGALSIRMCIPISLGGCEIWDGGEYAIHAASADSDWMDSWLDCAGTGCADGLDANSVDPSPDAFFPLADSRDKLSTTFYLPMATSAAGAVDLNFWGASTWWVDEQDSAYVGACDPAAACEVGP